MKTNDETLTKPKKLKEEKIGNIYDVIILGSGPAGMSCAVYCARGKLKVLILEKAMPGGQACSNYNVENYLGFPKGIIGQELAKRMDEQLNSYSNITKEWGYILEACNLDKKVKTIKTDLGKTFQGRTIVIATGTESKKLDTEGEKEFRGRGISYSAAVDGIFYTDKEVVVVGGGGTAIEEALFLTNFAKKVTVIYKSSEMRAVKILRDRILENDKVEFVWNSIVVSVEGDKKINKIKIRDVVADKERYILTSAVFVSIGKRPNTKYLNQSIKTDEEGYIVTDEYMRTNAPGVYAAGDVRSKPLRQIVTAANDGAIAAVMIDRYLGI